MPPRRSRYLPRDRGARAPAGARRPRRGGATGATTTPARTVRARAACQRTSDGSRRVGLLGRRVMDRHKIEAGDRGGDRIVQRRARRLGDRGGCDRHSAGTEPALAPARRRDACPAAGSQAGSVASGSPGSVRPAGEARSPPRAPRSWRVPRAPQQALGAPRLHRPGGVVVLGGQAAPPEALARRLRVDPCRPRAQRPGHARSPKPGREAPSGGGSGSYGGSSGNCRHRAGRAEWVSACI